MGGLNLVPIRFLEGMTDEWSLDRPDQHWVQVPGRAVFHAFHEITELRLEIVLKRNLATAWASRLPCPAPDGLHGPDCLPDYRTGPCQDEGVCRVNFALHICQVFDRRSFGLEDHAVKDAFGHRSV